MMTEILTIDGGQKNALLSWATIKKVYNNSNNNGFFNNKN